MNQQRRSFLLRALLLALLACVFGAVCAARIRAADDAAGPSAVGAKSAESSDSAAAKARPAAHVANNSRPAANVNCENDMGGLLWLY